MPSSSLKAINSRLKGSLVVAGTFQSKLLEIKDENRKTLSDVLQSLNYNPEKLQEDAMRSEDLLGYFEIHVEQGNILYDKNIPVAVVNSIRGQKRIEIKFSGKAGHAGAICQGGAALFQGPAPNNLGSGDHHAPFSRHFHRRARGQRAHGDALPFRRFHRAGPDRHGDDAERLRQRQLLAAGRQDAG